MRPKLVVHLVYTLNGPGAVEARARADLLAAAHAGHRVIAVTDRLSGDPPPGARVWASTGLGLWRGFPAPALEVAQAFVVARGLDRALRGAAPDVIVFHSSTLVWPAVRAARRHGARSVFMVHALIRDRLESGGASPYGRATTALYSAANAAALRDADRVVCVSRHMAKLAQADGVPPERLRVVPNPVDLEAFRADHAVRDIDVLFVGRLSPEKGVDVLLDAVAGLPEGVRVVIAGDGPLRGSLEARARECAASVRFAGWVGADELPALYRRASLAVVPSRSEPQGVVVLEALASGTPVVGSDTGGIPEMVAPGVNGWLVEPGRPERLRDVLAEALDDRDQLERMRGAARESATVFGPERLPDALAAAYLD